MRKMKKISIYQCKLGLVWGIFLTYSGLQMSCTPENPINRNVQMILQIPLPNPDGLKNASSITGVKSVMLTVTTENEILISKELAISGNTANGTVSILPGKNIKFTAEARDEKSIIQWQGSTTVDIDEDFTVDIKLTSIPPSANNLQALQKGKSVQLSWTRNSDPDFVRYDLYRSQSNGILGTILHSTTVVTETGFEDGSVSEGNTYFYTLMVTDTEEFNTKSNVVRSDLLDIPPTASALQGGFDGLVRLNWTQNTDTDFAKYELYRSQTAGLPGAIIFSTTVITKKEFIDIFASKGNIYFYTLVVTDTKALTTKSNVVQIDIPLIPPTASVLQGVFDGSVRLSWTQNTETDFAKYELYRSQSASLPGTIIFSTTVDTNKVFVDTKALEGNIYFYTLVVTDTKGLNAKSNVVQINIPIIPPTASVLQGGLDGSVYLNWTQNTDSDFAKYELYRSQSASLPGSIIFSTTVVTNKAFIDNDVSEGNVYFYTLMVTDTKGLNSRSNLVQIDVPFNPPTASVLRQDSVNSNMVVLSWTQNTDSDFAGYNLYQSPSENLFGSLIYSTTIATNRQYIDYQVSEGNTYFYRLEVIDTKGSISRSNVVKIDIPLIPPTASILNYKIPGFDPNHQYNITLSWSQNPNSDFARYELWRASSSNNLILELKFSTTNVKELEYVDINVFLPPDRKYYYTLYVIDKLGLGTKSNELVITEPPYLGVE